MKNLSYYFIFVTIIIFQACGEDSGDAGNPGSAMENQSQNQGSSVEIVVATSEDISEQIKSFGNIRAAEIVNVTPQISNRVTAIYADLGDTVRQGEVMAKIYDVPFQDQFQQAKSQLEQSRSTYVRDSLQFNRQQSLHDKELISSTAFDEARATFQNSKAQFEASKANLTQSREDLQNTEITSPVYGVVLTRNISTGDLASTGQVAYEIGNLTGLQARIYLPLEEWRKVQIGQSVNFKVSGQQDITGQGRVTQISPRIDPTTGLGEVVISLTDQGSSIYQGVLVQSIINVDTHKNAVVIPRSALVENVQTLIEPESNTIQLERSYSAFVVQDDSLALRKDLSLGIEQGNQIEILEGLEAGDQVIITGQNSLSDSAKVRVAGQETFQPTEEIPIESSEQDTADTSSTSP